MANNTTTTPPSARTVRIGVFVPYAVQLLDAACVDIFGSMSKQYLEQLGEMTPASLRGRAPRVEILYIGNREAGEGHEPLVAGGPPTIKMTSDQRVVATHDFRDPDVAPGRLDVVLVPGPDPFVDFGPDALAWLAAQGASEGTDVLSVCTGIFLCGGAGLLRGRAAAGPRGFQDLIRSRGFGERELVGHRLRWVRDGNFWSAGEFFFFFLFLCLSLFLSFSLGAPPPTFPRQMSLPPSHLVLWSSAPPSMASSQPGGTRGPSQIQRGNGTRSKAPRGWWMNLKSSSD